MISWLSFKYILRDLENNIVVTMSYVVTQPSTDVVSAFQKMRSGLLLFLIAWIFLMVLGIWFLALLFSGAFRDYSSVLAEFSIWNVLFIIGAIIAFIGFFARFIPGVSDLARANPEFSTASLLIKIGYVVGIILVIIGLILIPIIIGIFILIVGIIFTYIGYVGMTILCIKLNNKYKNTLYLVAGILVILGIFILILEIIALALLYVALGDTIRKLQTPPTQELISV